MVQISPKHVPIQNQFQLQKYYAILNLGLSRNVNTTIYDPTETKLYLHLTDKGLAIVMSFVETRFYAKSNSFTTRNYQGLVILNCTRS